MSSDSSIDNKHFIVVTSIAEPTMPMKSLAEGARRHGFGFVCIGDKKGPGRFHLDGCEFHSFESQRELNLRFARECPANHYARKNIGYLLAIRRGADWIVDVDDDNEPLETFWKEREPAVKGRFVQTAGWMNAYSFFGGGGRIWPRGLPLDEVKAPSPGAVCEEAEYVCLVQQGLANGDPDVDAIYRLTGTLPFSFEVEEPLILSGATRCPFNSQNTSWWRDAFPLLYLPSHCSFRMTDIWRSLVAQACLQPNGWHVSFHAPSVVQDRNRHDLMKDFEDEISGYVGVRRFNDVLGNLDLAPGVEELPGNLTKCYEALVSTGLIGPDEVNLLEAWLDDLQEMATAQAPPEVLESR